MSFLQVSEVSKKGVIENISLDVEEFRKVAIAGETGSGKTTLLRLMGGLAQADYGIVKFLNRRVEGPLEKLIPGHPGIAYLSQHFELRNNYWIYEILAYANELSDAEARRLYEICRISHLLKRRTDQLSGGERQRIALARLLSNKPRLLLLDEPFTNLDRIHKKNIQEVIRDIGEELNITCILVSHDAEDILSWADEIIILKEGKVVQHADPRTIYFRPLDEYCAGLLGDYNLLPAADGKRLFLRPEQIDISLQAHNASRQGIVTRIGFCGSFYLAEVQCGEEILQVHTTGNVFAEGMDVYLSFKDEFTWRL